MCTDRYNVVSCQFYNGGMSRLSPASTPKSDSLLLALSVQRSKGCPQSLGVMIDAIFFDNHSVIAVHVQSTQMFMFLSDRRTGESYI